MWQGQTERDKKTSRKCKRTQLLLPFSAFIMIERVQHSLFNSSLFIYLCFVVISTAQQVRIMAVCMSIVVFIPGDREKHSMLHVGLYSTRRETDQCEGETAHKVV